MKKLTWFLIALITSILFACQPPVAFDKPQPADVDKISGFPKRIQGKYLSNQDNSVLQVSSDALIRIYDYEQKIYISQLDSNFQLIGDSLFDLRTNKGEIVRIEGDSLVQQMHETDTLFRIDELNVLKKFKGYYFANIYIVPQSWQVKKLEFSRKSLIISDISVKEDLAQLKEITETTQDTVPYVFSPTRREFKTFVRNDGFRDSEEFTKISN